MPFATSSVQVKYVKYNWKMKSVSETQSCITWATWNWRTSILEIYLLWLKYSSQLIPGTKLPLYHTSYSQTSSLSHTTTTLLHHHNFIQPHVLLLYLFDSIIRLIRPAYIHSYFNIGILGNTRVLFFIFCTLYSLQAFIPVYCIFFIWS